MSESHAISLKRTSALLAALLFIAMLTVVNFVSFFSARAGAAQLSDRSLTLASTLEGDVGAATPVNSETNGDSTTHTFRFDVQSATALQAVRFEYCTTAIGTCTTPTGVDHTTNDPTISAQTINGGAWGAVWAEGTHTAGRINLTNTGTGALTPGHQAVFTFTGIENPNDVGTFFVRITTYSDAFTTLVDEGTVSSAIVAGIYITSKVAETLGFSTTADFAGGVGDPGASCSAVTGSGAIALGDPDEGTLSLAVTYEAYSAFRTYTNAANGVVVQYEGATLTKGTDEIDEIGGTPEAVDAGMGTDEQFGLGVDLVSGTDPTVNINSSDTDLDMTYVDVAATFGTDPGELNILTDYADGAGDITTGAPTFLFVADAATTMASAATYVDCVTAAVRYVANISPLTPAGTYTSTIVYSAVPTF